MVQLDPSCLWALVPTRRGRLAFGLKDMVVSVVCAILLYAGSGWGGGLLVAAEPKRDRGKDDTAENGYHFGTVGNPLAPGLMALVKQEMRDGLATRRQQSNFQRFVSYTAMKLDTTAGPMSPSEVTGNCRLRWFDYLMRHPLEAPIEAEKFTRHLHAHLMGGPSGLDRALILARSRMDCGVREARSFAKVTSTEQALDVLEQVLTSAQSAYAAALAPLTTSELAELNQYLYPIFVGNNTNGHTLVDRGMGRRLCDLMEKMDQRAWFNAADALIPLTDPELLQQFKAIASEETVPVKGVSGKVVKRIVTSAGTILVGGKDNNIYDLDQLENVAAVVDLGGNDVYREGVASLARPVLVVIDLGGDDRYEGSRPGIQGGAVLGISMLVDLEGRDTYRAQDVAQGSALCGVGILLDFEGADYYAGIRRVQGHALGGIGLLLDRAGNDSYRAAMWAQGFGGPLGFGLLDDLDGKDHYFAGGLYFDSYPETPGYEGWSQGVGSGLRQVANGGIGVILDGGGDDVYEYDYMSHGGGYWLGVGFARDFGGNDRRYGGTRVMYNGAPRGEPEFQRFSCGFGCHYAPGFCFDDAGDDTYGGTIMCLGFGWDDSLGGLFDFGGNDRYEATGGGNQGSGAQASIGILFDYMGNDVYLGYSQGYAAPDISYHPLPQCGGNFSFLIDYGGNDTYGCGAENNTYNVRGAESGFLIDRPLPEESAAKDAARSKKNPAPQAAADSSRAAALGNDN